MRLAEINIDITKLDSTHANYNANVAGLCVQAVTSGAIIKYNDNGVVTYNISTDNLPMALAKAIVSLGLEVKNYPFFIKVVPTDTVPVGIPGRTYIDDNEDEITHTWDTWKSNNFDIHVGTDGFSYIAAEANTADSVYLGNFSTVFDDCIDTASFKALMPGDE